LTANPACGPREL